MFKYVVKREVEQLVDIALLMPVRFHPVLRQPVPQIPGIVFDTPFAMMSKVPFMAFPDAVAVTPSDPVMPAPRRGPLPPRCLGPAPPPEAPPRRQIRWSRGPYTRPAKRGRL